MIYLCGLYIFFFLVGIKAVWPDRKNMPLGRFIPLLIVSPVTELTLIFISLPSFYVKQLKHSSTFLKHKSTIKSQKEVRSADLGGLRLLK